MEYDLLSFTLMCEERTLAERANQRDDLTDLGFLVLEEALARGKTIKLDTSNRSPDQVAEEMLAVILRI